MKIQFAALFACAAALLPACRSTSEGSAGADDQSELVCICGQPEANITGCYYPACVSHEGNPDNPECVCGGITAVQGEETFTSTGDAPAVSRYLGTPQTFYRNGGGTIRGTLLSDDGLSIQVQLSDGTTKTYAYSDLDPRSVFRLLRGRASDDNGPANLEAADYARDHGWYAHAKRHYEIAYKADPSLAAQVKEGMAKLRELASQAELESAKAAMKDGKPDEAEEHLQVILREFPEETAAASATAMLNEIDAREATMTRSTPDMSEEVEKALAPAQRSLDRAKKLNMDGLTSMRTGSGTEKSFEKAISGAGDTRKTLARLMEKNPGEGQLQRAAAQLDAEAQGLIVDASMNLASIYMTRTSYSQALRIVNQALAAAPNDPQLRNMRARIEDASSRGWGGGWVVVR